ncbi:acyl-CoA thioesterase [Demequina litorisediminis]|uniref:Thioesterase n=1 Tax=Demequina litorisediminis TaxID=1849022 RepID=A0ABQ6IGA9_9MICO|nr:thioesterase family protein [Demequina litorisediminis]GMA36784.1 thioesterase [Demequina litorisediminis]
MSRLHVPISLRWSDIDAYGHVNNAEMLRLLEEARIRVFWADDAGAEESADPEAKTDSPAAVLAGGPGAETHTLIASQQIEYLAPAPFQRRPLDVQAWIGRLGGASLEICYEVRSPRTGEGEQTVYARAATTLVLVDAASGRPRRLSDEQKAAWLPYVDEPVQFRRR